MLGIKLSIRRLPSRMDRFSRIVWERGFYNQHAQTYMRRDAVCRLIDFGRYPHCKEYKTAMRRLLSEEEFKMLDKKPRYSNPQGGPR